MKSPQRDRRPVLVVGAIGVAMLSLGASGCQGNLETQARMFRHFGQAHRIQTAAVFGRHDVAKDAAAQMRNEAPVPGLPDGSESYVQSLQESAARVEFSQYPEVVPAMAAQMADDCGSCHEAFEVGPLFGVGVIEDSPELGQHMKVHAWASERMWEGLVSRSEESWQAGATALSGHRIEPDEYVPAIRHRGTAFMLSSRAHYLAESSQELTTWEERAGLFSRLTETCYECHNLAGMR
ncbi:MAG: hypothetical protein ACR2QM_14110 [Longimicrobiales bacterium]